MNQKMADLITEADAAEYLGFKPATLRQARWKGELAGIKPPKHVNLGRLVRYRTADLDQWVDEAISEGESNEQENA